MSGSTGGARCYVRAPLITTSSQQIDHSDEMTAAFNLAPTNLQLAHLDIMAKTGSNIARKKTHKKKTLRNKFKVLWRESQRPGPHPPLVFEEDTPIDALTHLECQPSSHDEGSEVRTRPSANYSQNRPPFPPRISQETPGPHPPLGSEEDTLRESLIQMECQPSSPDEGSEVRTRPSAGYIPDRAPFPPRIFPLQEMPSPHPPLGSEDDNPQPPSPDEGSEVRTRPSSESDLSPFSPRIFPPQETLGPHPPLGFEEDFLSEAFTLEEMPTSSSDEGSEVRTQPSITVLIRQMLGSSPPPGFEDNTTSEPSTSSADEGPDEQTRRPSITDIPCATFPLPFYPLPVKPEVTPEVRDLGIPTQPKSHPPLLFRD